MDRSRTSGFWFLKGISAIIIANLYHYRNDFSIWPGVACPVDNVRIPILGGVLRWLSVNGLLLVELFFEISGFLFVTAYLNKITDDRINAKEFFIKRIAKIYPMMLLSSVAMYILELCHYQLHNTWWLNSTPDIWHFVLSSLGISTGWFLNITNANMPVWYVAILFQCYAIAYFITWLIKKYKLSKILFVIPIVLALSSDGSTLAGSNFLWMNYNSSRGLKSFFAGVLIAVLIEEYGDFLEIRKTIVCFTSVAVITWVLVIGKVYGSDLVGDLYDVLDFLIYPSVIMLSIYCDPIRKLIALKPFVWLGKISFEIYLWNLPLQLATYLLSDITGIVFHYESMSFFIMHMIICTVIAGIIYIFVEIPINKKTITLVNKIQN